MNALLHIDLIWISAAVLLGLVSLRIKLPPLVGFLLAGFLLNAFGLKEGNIALEEMAELGVMLLLFTIGLKLDLSSLFKREIILTTGLHMLAVVLLMSTLVQLAAVVGLYHLAGLDLKASLLIGFALSFSSTVYAVKALEDKDELNSFHGKLAIGVLIMQDIFAVIFLTISKGKLPSVWTFALPLYLWLARKAIFWMIDRAGHGELFTLVGFFTALVAGASVFDLLGLKADLGALVAGILLSKHPRAAELSKTLMGYKDLFLVGFFFQIGMSGVPHWSHIGIALMLIVVLVVKSGLFFGLLTAQGFRARSAFLTGTNLSTYSEFGLIVAAIGHKMAWLSSDWLIILAIAMSLSFVVTAPVDMRVHRVFDHLSRWLLRFERAIKHPDDELHDLGSAQVLVFGMGRMGTAAYDKLKQQFGPVVVGLDYNHDRVSEHQLQGRNVVWGDATDLDFWQNLSCKQGKLVLLAMDNHASNTNAARELVKSQQDLLIAATANFADEIEELNEIGVSHVYDIHASAGNEFAGFLIQLNNKCEKPVQPQPAAMSDL